MANVDEALTLLQQYDLHASMGMMIHFALADTTGRGVVVEYINNEMVVTETPVVTNSDGGGGGQIRLVRILVDRGRILDHIDGYRQAFFIHAVQRSVQRRQDPDITGCC